MNKNLFAYVPLDVYFIITRRCNFHCVYCVREPVKNLPADMPATLFNALLDSIRGLSVRKIVLTGGEPLLHPEVLKIFKSAVAHYETVICTNGWFLCGRLPEFAWAGSSKVSYQISLDSVGSKHDKIVKLAGAYTKILQAIEVANDNGIKPIISTTVGDANISDMHKLFQVLKGFNIQTWKISPEMPCLQSNESSVFLNASRWNVLVEEVRGLTSLGGIEKISCKPMFAFGSRCSPVRFSDLTMKLAGCEAGKARVYFRTDGSISLCPLLDRYIVYPPQQDFVAWWLTSEELNEFRDFPIERLSECSGCRWVRLCKGGCHGTTLYEYGTPFRADPRCPFVKSNIKVK